MSWIVCLTALPWAGERKWPSLQASSAATPTSAMLTMLLRFEGWWPSNWWCGSTNGLRFWLWKTSDARSPPLRREECLRRLFFGLRTNFVNQSDQRRRESSWPPVFAWSFDQRKKSLWVALEYMRIWVGFIKLRAKPASWSTGHRPPRDRGCERTFETKGQNGRARYEPCSPTTWIDLYRDKHSTNLPEYFFDAFLRETFFL